MDPHGNLSEAMVAATDALLAYRTNPHLDQRETGLRAARLMVRTLQGDVKPVQAAVFPPMAINIQSQNTSQPPLRELYAEVEAVEEQQAGKVLGVSVVLGFPYADVSEMGSSLLVVTDGDAGLARQVATGLGRRLWELREAFEPEFLSPHRAVREAVAGGKRTLLLEMGDNVGGGSPGNGTVLLGELDRRGAGPAFVCLWDPAGVAQASALGVGGVGEMHLAQEGDALHGGPLTLECEVIRLCDGRFRETAVRHGGLQCFDMGRCAVVRTPRGLTLLLTSRRVPPFSLEQLRCCGLEPGDFAILVAKGVIAPLAAYGPVVEQVRFVNTPGVTCADMTQLPFHHRRRPLFPFERGAHWEGEGPT
jgi:microcystin degradation protein MlrC